MTNTQYTTSLTIPVRIKDSPIPPEEQFNWDWIFLGGGAAVAALLIIFVATRR